jgi:hypothetical protein
MVTMPYIFLAFVLQGQKSNRRSFDDECLSWLDEWEIEMDKGFNLSSQTTVDVTVYFHGSAI